MCEYVCVCVGVGVGVHVRVHVCVCVFLLPNENWSGKKNGCLKRSMKGLQFFAEVANLGLSSVGGRVRLSKWLVWLPGL